MLEKKGVLAVVARDLDAIALVAAVAVIGGGTVLVVAVHFSDRSNASNCCHS